MHASPLYTTPHLTRLLTPIQCYHTRDKYFFLPKGRKNANESVTSAAEREGFEESGYRNRLLPLPMKHRQPLDPVDEGKNEVFATEALWTQFLPLSRSKQYLLFWFAAETLPENLEMEGDEMQAGRNYRVPPPFPEAMTVKDRIALDQAPETSDREYAYEPKWHAGTGVDDEEKLYKSYLLPIDEACKKLKGSVMEDVVRRGWEAIKQRMNIEDGWRDEGKASGVIAE